MAPRATSRRGKRNACSASSKSPTPKQRANLAPFGSPMERNFHAGLGKQKSGTAFLPPSLSLALSKHEYSKNLLLIIFWHWWYAGQWKAPKLSIPVQQKFCTTAEQFNFVHGLSMEGASPKIVRWEQIFDAEWFSIFREPKDSGRYCIKCSCI